MINLRLAEYDLKTGKFERFLELGKEFTYGGSCPVLPTAVVLNLYDGTALNLIERTITDTITYLKVFELSRTRIVS